MNLDLKKLLLDLYNAPNADSLYQIILSYGLDGSEYWKPYGGNFNNAGTFENQQSSPENALVEKLTNSIDAILMKECMIRGIQPKDKNNPNVPQTINEATKMFFNVDNGKWENIVSTERNRIAQDIQIILTDDRKTPNVAIYDNGEGQNPSNFENTFLSIARGNKNDVPFVQGKYNMGSTGSLVFCGEKHRYQMIISRRNTNLTDSDGLIGFTLVRRHILTPEEEPKYKLTWYEYLVIDDKIPSISDEQLDLGLNKTSFICGSVVKLYSYQLTHSSDATLDLWRDLNPLLFESALPILIYENRGYGGHSSTKVMLGNRTRLALDSNEHIEFQKSFQINLFNSNIPIQVYLFNRDTKNTEFILGKSVVYTLNGQTQGAETKSFISQDLGFRNLREFMLVCVDCSQIGTTARQELFMASRDRLKQGRFYTELRQSIIDLLSNDTHLKQKEQEYKGRVFRETGEDKDMVQSLFSKLKGNQDIRKMFSGNNGAFSFFTKKVKKPIPPEEQKEEKKKEAKKLKRYPTVLKIKGFERSSEDFVKVIRKGGKGKIILETDVENTFLSRSDDAGAIEITTLDFGKHGGLGGGHNLPSEDSTKLRVQFSGPCEGEMEVMIEPREEAEVGDSIQLSIKMISSAGEHEVVAFIKIDNEAQKPKEPKEKIVEEPELSLPKLTRVVQHSDDPDQAKWSDYGMTSDSIVKIQINNNGAIDEVLINMDSNLVKKLINAKGANVERVRNKYISSIYSHVLMVYTTMYGYYSKDDIEIDEHIRKDIQESLDKAVEFSFQYYGNFILTYEDFSD
ncbi:MAG: hypothetical protein IJX80_09970 [Clostridia bacterium]|nr:hypothetical protein [Clostridia bacterium]